MRILSPPMPIEIKTEEKTIFLAGSIEQGIAEDWQTWFCNELQNSDYQGLILNPRRVEWDKSWLPNINNPTFKAQVNWELEGMEKADWVVYYFHPASQAPITLLELGLHARSGKTIVCCPEGFWRKGNVDVVCERYDIPQVENLKDLLQTILKLNKNQ